MIDYGFLIIPFTLKRTSFISAAIKRVGSASSALIIYCKYLFFFEYFTYYSPVIKLSFSFP